MQKAEVKQPDRTEGVQQLGRLRKETAGAGSSPLSLGAHLGQEPLGHVGRNPFSSKSPPGPQGELNLCSLEAVSTPVIFQPSRLSLQKCDNQASCPLREKQKRWKDGGGAACLDLKAPKEGEIWPWGGGVVCFYEKEGRL